MYSPKLNARMEIKRAEEASDIEGKGHPLLNQKSSCSSSCSYPFVGYDISNNQGWLLIADVARSMDLSYSSK
jgi:hypothetical protein